MSITDDERYRLVDIFGMMTRACCATRERDGAGSTLAVDWRKLKYHAKTRARAEEKWALLKSNVGEDKEAMEQSDLEDYGEIFRGEMARPSVVILAARPNIGFQGKCTPCAAPNPTAASQMPASRASRAGPGPLADELGQLPEDMRSIADLLVQVMRAQAESTLTMHQSFQTTLLENIRAMGVAVSATGAVKEAKLTELKIKILRACSGEDDESLFVLPKVYSKVDQEGHTTDNYSW